MAYNKAPKFAPFAALISRDGVSHMRVVLLLALTLVSCGSVHACSCWKNILPLDHPENPQNLEHFVFKIISGDLIIDEKTKNKEGGFSTVIEVLSPGTTDRAVGEKLELIQKYNFCTHSFIPNYQYKFLGESSGTKVLGNYCNIKHYPTENDELSFDKWLSNQTSNSVK